MVIPAARRTFGDFLYVLMIGLVFLVPHQVPYSLSIALALDRAGDRPGALDALEQAPIPAEPEGYLRVFLDEGEALQHLLSEFVIQKQATPYAWMVFQNFDESEKKHTQPTAQTPAELFQADLDPLSEREMEVLRHIARGDSNQEIADQLVISITTVKRHISNIYAKLHGCQAVPRLSMPTYNH